VKHIPVLQKEVLEYLAPKPNQNFIDCTIGQGGHSLAILERILPNGKILGIDYTPELISKLKPQTKKFKENFILVCDNFANLKKIVEKYNFKKVQGILFDLGMSNWHLEKSGRGFSFLRDEILDIRYNLGNSLTAQEIVNDWLETELVRILKEYGEERFAKKIAKKIIEERLQPTRRPPTKGGPLKKPIKTTFQLVEIIKKAVPLKYQKGRIHPATRTFQALRIAVNDELENLKKVLPQALEILEKNRRLVIISFHSLEDRISKNFLSAFAKGFGGQERKLKILTKKPIRPSKEEISINPRSRSAKLRAAIKI